MSDTLSLAESPMREAKRVRPALLAKEWLEHRWRFLLGTIVLSTLLGGMLRAQVVPFHEAAITIYWPVGVILTIFLAMGPVATEKTNRTWEFLLAQPVPKWKILLAKWRMGLYELLGMTSIACAVGVLAMWSRGFYGRASIWQWMREEQRSSIESWLRLATEHPALWLILLAGVATAALCCWYTFLFFVLVRARNEFEAALGGLLLTLAAHAWLAQIYFPALRPMAGLNPFAVFAVLINPNYLGWLPIMVPVHLLLWVGAPLGFNYLLSRRAHV